VTISEEGFKLPSSLVAFVALAKSSLSPCIERLLGVIAVLPVTTCSFERSVSSLRRLETYLRATMMRPRLDGLALMHVHYTREVNIDEVIRRFLTNSPRSIISPITVTARVGDISDISTVSEDSDENSYDEYD
jgi:hypothetical protein